MGYLLAAAMAATAGCDGDDGVESSQCQPGSLDPTCQGQGGATTATNGTDTGGATLGQPTDSGVTPTVQKDLPCDVAPILETYCHDCHGLSQQWGAPMPLVQSSDFQGSSPSLPNVSMTQRVLDKMDDVQSPMPPPQSPQPSAEELATLKQWLQAGAPAATGSGCGVDAPVPGDGGTSGGDGGGDGGSTEEPVSFEGAPEDCTEFHALRAHHENGEEDTTPYHVPEEPLDSGNQYMCFYFSLPYEAGSQGLWFEPIIDDSRVLHHWLLYGTNNAHSPGGTRGACSAAEPGAYLLAGWAPGADSFRYPDDVGLQMPSGPNAGLILEVHYYNTQKLTDAYDRSGVKFCTAPGGTREHTAGVHFLGSEAICVQPGEQKDVEGWCDPTNEEDGIHILNVWPHMHEIGTHMRATIHRAGGGTETLHDAPFDFNNQINYPKDDVIIRPGDQIQTFCTYQNTRDVQAPFGDKTQDEMCYLFVTAWPVDSLSNDPTGRHGGLVSPVNAIAAGLQPLQRCMDPTSIFGSCNGLLDYPTSF